MASIAKRGQSWFAQVARRGVRKSQSFGTRGEAEAWAARTEAEITGTAPAPTPAMVTASPLEGELTLGDVLGRYRRELKPTLRWGPTKEWTLERLTRDLGSVRLSALTSERVVQFAQMRAEGGASPATVQRDISYLSSALKVARAVWKYPVRSEVITDAQEAMRLLGLVGQSRKRNRIASDAELAALRLAWRSSISPSIIDFAVLSCMRLGEILRISREDRDGHKILVRERKHPDAAVKADNNQWVPLLNGAAELLDGLPGSGGRYFPHHKDALERAWQRACARAKVHDLNFHDLRHTGLTRLRKQGLGVPELQVVSGHRDWKMLQRYVNLTADDLLAARQLPR